jgi:hypothetical protein
MEPRRDKVDRTEVEREGPAIEQQDWDEFAGAEFDPDAAAERDEMLSDIEQEGEVATEESLEEDDDNPYQDSDEALPDDDEEQAIRGNLGGKGVRYEPE